MNPEKTPEPLRPDYKYQPLPSPSEQSYPAPIVPSTTEESSPESSADSSSDAESTPPPPVAKHRSRRRSFPASSKQRQAFVRQSLAAVAAHLAGVLFAAALITLFYKKDLYLHGNAAVSLELIGGLVGAAGSLVTFVAFPSTRYTTPYNYIIFSIFTLSLTFIVSFFASQVDGITVLLSMCITLLSVVGVTAVSYTNWFDITSATSIVFLLMGVHGVVDLSVFSLAYFMNVWSEPLFIYLGIIVAFFFTCFLVYDIATIVGGKHEHIGPDDPILASMSIYPDAVDSLCVWNACRSKPKKRSSGRRSRV